MGPVPERLQVDNGSAFLRQALDKWAYEPQVTLDFSRRGNPTDTPPSESFKGSVRDAWLKGHWFLSLTDAQEKIEPWRQQYNRLRPHSSRQELTPDQAMAAAITVELQNA